MIWVILHYLSSYKYINSISSLSLPLLYIYIYIYIYHTFRRLTFKKKRKEMVEADIRVIQNALFDPPSKQQIQSYYSDLLHFFCPPSLTFLAIFFYFLLRAPFSYIIHTENLSLVFKRFIMQFLKMMCCYNFKKLFT